MADVLLRRLYGFSRTLPVTRIRNLRQRRTTRERRLPDQTASAFVLMPFDEAFTDIYEALLKPALEEAGYTVTRADSPLDQQNVMRDIIEGISRAHLIVADITGRNANVMYELGIAHGLGRPTVMLAQSIDDVPFDLRSYRIKQYSTHFKVAQTLRAELVRIGAEHLEGQLSFGSPVSDFAQSPGPADASSGAVARTDEQANRGADDPQPDEDLGLLDHFEAAHDASTVFVNGLSAMTAEIAVVGVELSAYAERVERLNDGESGAAAARQFKNIALKASGVLDGYSARMEELLPEVEEAAGTIIETGLAYAEWLQAPDADPEQVESTRAMAEGLLYSVRGGLEGILGFRESAVGLRGISTTLTKASKRVERNLDRVVVVMERVESYGERTLALLEVHEGPKDEADAE